MFPKAVNGNGVQCQHMETGLSPEHWEYVCRAGEKTCTCWKLLHFWVGPGDLHPVVGIIKGDGIFISAIFWVPSQSAMLSKDCCVCSIIGLIFFRPCSWGVLGLAFLYFPLNFFHCYFLFSGFHSLAHKNSSPLKISGKTNRPGRWVGLCLRSKPGGFRHVAQ